MKNKSKLIAKKMIVWMMLMTLTFHGVGISSYAAQKTDTINRTTDQSVIDTVTLTKTETNKETTRTTDAETAAEGFYNNDAEFAITKTAGYDSGIVNADGGSAEIIWFAVNKA